MFGLRFDFRNPAFAGVSMADRYDAALEMAEWADRLGCLTLTVSEHHGSEDGYLPSPLPMLAAMAARTTNVRLMVAAIIAPFYDPLRLAEDLLVLDHLSRGRVDVIVAGGYVGEEFDMFGVPIGERAKRVTETVETLRASFTGEAFAFRGRKVRLTPSPYREGGPGVMLGGSSDAAARRAARIADGFIPSVPEVWDAYRDECIKLGKPDPGPGMLPPAHTVALATDPDEGWKAHGPYFLYESNAYGKWIADSGAPGPYKQAADLDELRTMGDYSVVTPAQMVDNLKAAPFPFAIFHPMCGGTPPELAWSSLKLFESEVLNAL
ncbi:MAG TPA: LLM class flavin-dependent oxidoreductase [Mycobacteriales bacterium]|nr:LLM class flavin-dependent oxidoreductase [Mycobacteriales bacterium]